MSTAVITGASRGLGRAFAGVLAHEGYDLALGARSQDALDAAAQAFGGGADDGPGVGVLAHSLDVRDPRALDEFSRAVADRYETVDVLVANAGIGAYASIASFDPDTFDDLFAVNVRGVFNTLRAFDSLLADGALVVVVSSDVSARVFPGGGPYCATKHAVRALARTYQQERPDLRVLELRPGSTETDFAGIVRTGRMDAMRVDDVAETLRTAVRLPRNVRLEEVVVRSVGQQPTY